VCAIPSLTGASGHYTLDLLPHLHEPQPGIAAPIGYSGRGLAMGTALDTVLARRALGEPARSLPYPVTSLSAIPFNAPRVARQYLALAYKRLRDLVQ
jgi:hypothetical protein